MSKTINSNLTRKNFLEAKGFKYRLKSCGYELYHKEDVRVLYDPKRDEIHLAFQENSDGTSEEIAFDNSELMRDLYEQEMEKLAGLEGVEISDWVDDPEAFVTINVEGKDKVYFHSGEKYLLVN